MLKKLFMTLCVVIMFFVIVDCPSPDNPATSAITKSELVGYASGNDIASPVPEPLTLVLIGSGLVGLAVIGRKSFKK